MKSMLTRILVVFALAFVAVYANAQTPPDAHSLPEVPDPGSVTGSTYTNKYFGLTLPIPAGWTVQEADIKKQINEKGKELVTSDDPTTKDKLDRAVDKTLNLLTITEHPLDSSAPSNAMLICGAEQSSGIKSDAAYMLAVKHTLTYSQVPVTIKKEVYSEQIGGVAFSVMDLETDYSGVIVSQRYYARLVKNHFLFFIVIYQTPEQLNTLTETLKLIKLQ